MAKTDKEKYLENLNLEITSLSIKVWLEVNQKDMKQVKDLEALIVESAKFEWGEKTQVNFESENKVVVSIGSYSKTFTK